MSENEIIRVLTERWVTREELCLMLGTSDVAMRAYVSDLNRRLAERHSCVLSTATRRGYHIPDATCEDDVRVALHAIDELKNKAISIFERRKALEDFTKYAEAIRKEPEPVQGSLF